MKSLTKITSLSQKKTAPRPAPRPQPAAAPSQDQGFVCVLLLSTPCCRTFQICSHMAQISTAHNEVTSKGCCTGLAGRVDDSFKRLVGRLANKGCVGR